MPFGEITHYEPRGPRTPRRYAWIRPDFGDRLYFVPSIALDKLHRTPRKGDRVRFRVQIREDGRRRAIDVYLVHDKPLR